MDIGVFTKQMKEQRNITDGSAKTLGIRSVAPRSWEGTLDKGQGVFEVPEYFNEAAMKQIKA